MTNENKNTGLAILCLCLLFMLAARPVSANSGTPIANLPDSNVASDWIVKDVCADNSTNVPVVADPYYACPPGSYLRKIKSNEPLPYHNIDQPGIQQGDNFPIVGNAGYVHTFDYPPFNQFNLYSGSDGYDLYTIDGSWVSSPGTRDGGGYGQVFFGANCQIGDGWIYFPTYGFLSGGSTASVAIGNNYWEQSLLSYPGNCPSGYGYPTTSWQLQRTTFGTVDGNQAKTMDAIVSFHNYNPGFQTNMEVYWFTQQYGLTMWQSWVPASTGATPTTNCAVTPRVSYGGFTYVVNDCHDWSRIIPATTPAIPQWPVPTANLLQHSHFDDGGGFLTSNDGSFYNWHRGGNSAEGNIINWSLFNSTAPRDTQYGTGVRYLATNCAGTCTGAGVQEIYQEVPITAINNGWSYLYGIDARSEAGSGSLQVTLQELDGSGHVLWQDYLQGAVAQDNGDGRNNEAASVYLSSAFIHKTTTIPVLSGATRVRFYITPLTPQTFDILDSWLNVYPIPWTGLEFQPASPDGTMMCYGSTCLATQLVDGSGNIWTVAPGAFYENGIGRAGYPPTNFLLAYKGQVYAENAGNLWYKWNGSSWIALAGDPRPVSASGTTIPPASEIVDGNRTIWTVAGGLSYENGVADGGANITLLLYYKGAIYADTTSGGWWTHLSGVGWIPIQVGDPRKATASPDGTEMYMPLANQLVDGSGNIWTVTNGAFYENGIGRASYPPTWFLLAYKGQVYAENAGSLWYKWNGSGWVAIAADPRG